MIFPRQRAIPESVPYFFIYLISCMKKVNMAAEKEEKDTIGGGRDAEQHQYLKQRQILFCFLFLFF